MTAGAWWAEVRIPVRSDAREAVIHHCLELGATGVREETGHLLTYFPLDVDGEDPATCQRACQRWLDALNTRLGNVRAVFGPGAVGVPAFTPVCAEDWANSWKPFYRPLRVGRRLVIVPLWLRETYPVDAGRLPIWMEPGLAFGTGEHLSTQLALVLLEAAMEAVTADAAGDPGSRNARRDPEVVDIGTGSGILAIAAARLGARRVWACDHDPVAVRVARANAAANGVADRITVAAADLFELARSEQMPPAADVLVANILFEPLRRAAGILASRVRVGGRIVLSGLTAEQREPLIQAYEAQGCRWERTVTVAGWSGLLLCRRAVPVTA